MIIYDNQEKGNSDRLKQYIILATIFLAILGVFGSYKLYKLKANQLPITVKTADMPEANLAQIATTTATTSAITTSKTGDYVASKTGSAYYLVTCAASNRIKDENKIYFKTKAEAEAKGLKPAKNCKGL